MDILIYIPVLALVLLANLGLRNRGLAILTYFALAALNVIFFVVGLAFLNPQASFAFQTDLALPPPGLISLAGVCFIVTAIVSTAFLISAVRKRAARVLPVTPASPLDAAALVLGVDLVGMSILQLILLPYFWDSLQEPLVTPGALWKQGLAFMIVGLLSVGYPLRRNLPDALGRLGLGLPRPAHLAWVAGAVAVAILLNIVVQLFWEWLQPELYSEMQLRLEKLFGEFGTTSGLLAVGLSAGIGEEILFRGAIQPRLGLVTTTFLFTIIHSYYGITPGLVWIAVLGLGLGILREKSNTTSCILFHAAYNAVSFVMGT